MLHGFCLDLHWLALFKAEPPPVQSQLYPPSALYFAFSSDRETPMSTPAQMTTKKRTRQHMLLAAISKRPQAVETKERASREVSTKKIFHTASSWPQKLNHVHSQDYGHCSQNSCACLCPAPTKSKEMKQCTRIPPPPTHTYTQKSVWLFVRLVVQRIHSSARHHLHGALRAVSGLVGGGAAIVAARVALFDSYAARLLSAGHQPSSHSGRRLGRNSGCPVASGCRHAGLGRGTSIQCVAMHHGVHQARSRVESGIALVAVRGVHVSAVAVRHHAGGQRLAAKVVRHGRLRDEAVGALMHEDGVGVHDWRSHLGMSVRSTLSAHLAARVVRHRGTGGGSHLRHRHRPTTDLQWWWP